MIQILRWRDVQAIADCLTPLDYTLIRLLAMLPLASADVLAQLAGPSSPATIYRRLARLRRGGLVDRIVVALDRGHCPRLSYLTDSGLAVLALATRSDPHDLGRRYQIRGRDLLALLPGMTHLEARYAMLGVLASSRTNVAQLRHWEHTWPRSARRGRSAFRATGPSLAEVAWDDRCLACFLLPDLATFPLANYVPALRRLLAASLPAQSSRMPLVIATGDVDRAAGWHRLFATFRLAENVQIKAHVVCWSTLAEALATIADDVVNDEVSRSERLLTTSTQLAFRPADRIPAVVGHRLPARATGSGPAAIGQLALQLTPADRELVNLVGRHPFLGVGDVAAILDWTVPFARARRNRLVELGILRCLNPEEQPGLQDELVELTTTGLRLGTAQQGLSLASAVRMNGLCGGGPSEPIGTRSTLLRHLSHTRGADGVFVELARRAALARASGRDEEIVEWRNAAACARGAVRPDGYGIYRSGHDSYGFFLEYDRGTVACRDYRRKFDAYHRYRESGRFTRDYLGFPTILVVTTETGSERRIGRAIAGVDLTQNQPLPVLVATLQRIAANRDGILGSIWWDIATGSAPCGWLRGSDARLDGETAVQSSMSGSNRMGGNDDTTGG